MNQPILCYVTERKALSAALADTTAMGPLLESIEAAARAGVDWIQLREKDLEGRALFELATNAITASRVARKQTKILVNDRLDVALAAAGGVHLGENSLPVADVTRWRNRTGRPTFEVGVSCHSLDAATQAAAGGADFIFFGPVFATPSKQAFGPPQGPLMLERVCRAVSVPVLAIGGITSHNASQCLQAGAAGIAAIRLFQQTPERVAAAISEILS